MDSIPSVPFIAVFCLLAALSVRILINQCKRLHEARIHGCQPIVKHPQAGLFFGGDYDQQQKQAWKEGALLQWARKQYIKCGSATYYVHTPGEKTIMSSDPLIQQIISTNLSDWVRLGRRGGKRFFGSSIMSETGPKWRHTRDLVNPLFKRSELTEIETFKTFVDILISSIPSDGTTIDMQPRLRKLFIDSSTEFIFGETLGATAGAGKRIRPSGLTAKLNTFFDTRDKQWLADIKVVHDFIDSRITSHQLGKEKQRPNRRYLLIDGMSEAFQDPVELRFQLLTIFSMARETSAMGFSNVLFLLARNPHVWKKLREQSLAGMRDGQDITYEWLKGQTFFRNTVLETLRLRNPTPMFRRKATRDMVLPRGGGVDGCSPTYITKGTLVTIDKNPMWQDPKVWGEDVSEFRPERFESRMNSWEFMPFNGGPQMCPANQQVILQYVYLLVRLTREFETIENRDPCLEYVESALMCIESRNGCQIAFCGAKGY